jgi:YjbE family integral membrane protein
MSGMLQPLLAIILIDLSLSADNALIIGLVARDLPPEHRRRAIIVGGALAVLFRVVLTALAAVLLTIPYLQLVGGLALLVIAYRLARPSAHGGEAARSATSLRGAIWMITVADLTTSLEHVLGIGGAAQGDIVLLLIGLAISIPIVLAGSGFVASIVGRLPWLIWLGVLALVWTGFDLFMDDPAIHRLVPDHWAIDVAFTALAVVLIFVFTRPRVAARRD